MGASVILVGPPTLMPPGALGCEVSTDLDGLLPTLDVVYMLRLQRERQDGYFIPGEDDFARMFALTRERAGMLPQGAAIMHAGPMNRGVEITTQAAESPAALIEDQVAAGVAVRMALLYLILGGPP
jgi:aspartate carbamoyltransferase catalytic subunit